MNKVIGRWLGFLLCMALVLGVCLYSARGKVSFSSTPTELKSYEPWDDEVIDLVKGLPIQDGGRVKPFESWAGYTMLAIRGDRKMKIKVGDEKVVIRPTEWMLNNLFRPDIANQLPTFRVDNSEILIDVGLKGKAKRDRYSFDYIIKARKLMEKREKELKDRVRDGETLKGADKQTLDLINQIATYMKYIGQLNILHRMEEGNSAEVLSAFKQLEEDRERIQELKSEARDLLIQIKELNPTLDPDKELGPDEELEMERIVASYKNIEEAVTLFGEREEFFVELLSPSGWSNIAMVPSTDPNELAWHSYGDWALKYAKGEAKFDEGKFEALSMWMTLGKAYQSGGQKALLAELKKFDKEVSSRVQNRQVADELAEFKRLNSEVKYNKKLYFLNSLVFSILSFIFIMVAYVAPKSSVSKWAMRLCWVVAILGFLYLVVGIAHRGYLMRRWPLGTLYETILVITAGAMGVLMFMEWITKRKICLGVMTVLSILGLTLAIRYEISNAKDTMAPLVAVLRSNYWLTVHVTTISFGYSGGLLTAALSHVYIFGRFFGIDNGDKSWRRFITRLTYGAVCFTLLFSLIGTILGGIWANDSWGRFWGWDPKENGALMIVLWYLIILHARLAGFIREWGLHVLSVLGAIIVTFSWWGVNFLGTGLHNYGFDDGEGKTVWLIFCILEFVIAMATMFGVLFKRMDDKAKKQMAETLKSEATHPPL